MNIYLPYIFGTGSPIPNLFENIVPHIAGEVFNFTFFTQGPRWHSEHVQSVQLPEGSPLRNWIKRNLTRLRPFDAIHTGGRENVHMADLKFAALRNRSLRHIHTFRVDVEPDSSFNTKNRRHLGEHADVTTAVSEHTAMTVREEFGLDPVIIYNGVDTDMFSPNHDPPEWFPLLRDDLPVFLYVGSLSSRKRPADILEVAKKVPEAQFLVVGGGPLFEDLSSRVVSLENIHLTGQLPKRVLPAIYANATAFLFPSIREGCPNVVLEAMASGLPIVGYDATSMPEIVMDGMTGYLVEAENVERLTEAARRLLDNTQASRMGADARDYINTHHTFDKIAADYRRIYSQLS